jgi:hypothetical protein
MQGQGLFSHSSLLFTHSSLLTPRSSQSERPNCPQCTFANFAFTATPDIKKPLWHS